MSDSLSKIGAAPGSILMAPSGAQPSRVRVTQYTLGSCDEYHDQEAMERLLIPAAKECLTWINIDGLGDPELVQSIANRLGIHKLALEDVFSTDQRPKVDFYDDVTFMVARMLVQDEDTWSTEQVCFFLSSQSLLTVQEKGGDCFDRVRDRIRHGKGRLRTSGHDYLMYALLDALVDAYLPAMELCVEELDDMEEDLLLNPRHEILENVHRIRRRLLRMRRTAWPQREAIRELSQDESSPMSDETQVYLQDCLDHADRVMDLIDTSRDHASSIMELHLSTSGHRLNEVMRFLTLVSTMFIPLTFVVGIYGMNFDASNSPWNMPELKWRYGYLCCLIVMATLAVLQVLYFRKKRWI